MWEEIERRVEVAWWGWRVTEKWASLCNTVIPRREGGREGCRGKGQPMGLHKAACGKSCVKRPWSLSSVILFARRCSPPPQSNDHVMIKQWKLEISLWSIKAIYTYTCIWQRFLPFYLWNTTYGNRGERERARQHKRERKHNSRALLNKKSVAINSKPSSWPQHCFRFRRPGFSLSFPLQMVTAYQNQIFNIPHRLFLFSLSLFFFLKLRPDLCCAGDELFI